jgi:hypothetical protein
MDRAYLRSLANDLARKASREELLDLLDNYKTNNAPVEALSAARQELVERYRCCDCGAVAGRECKPDYGCVNGSRRPLC